MTTKAQSPFKSGGTEARRQRCRGRDAESVEGVRNGEGVSPSHPSRGSGSVVSSPSGTPHIYPQNSPLSFDDNHRHLIQPFLDRLHLGLPPGCSQPFCHRTLFGPTLRQTDRQVIWHDASRSQWQEYPLLTCWK